MNIGWPEGIYLAIVFLGLCFTISNHGKPKTGEHDAGAFLLASAITLGLLYWGGFFS